MSISEVKDLKRQYHLLVGTVRESNNYGKFLVKELLPVKNPRMYRITFLETGFEKDYTPRQIITGKVKDDSLCRLINSGDVFDTNNCGSLKIIEEVSKNKYKVEFIATGTVKEVLVCNIFSGQIKDPYYPILYGVGFLGDETIERSSYSVWLKMLGRCYDKGSSSYGTYGGMGVKVSPQWHNYSNFKTWFLENKIEGFQLDKDVLCEFYNITPKVYSESTCCFLPKEINLVLSNKAYGDSDLPLGVTRSGKRFRSGYGITVRKVFNTLPDAVAHQIETKKDVWEVRLDKYSTELSGEVSEALRFVWGKEIADLEKYL